MDFIKYDLYEDTWTLYIIEDDDDVVTDEGTAAEVFFEKKEIYFRHSELRLNTVLHELFHVYIGYCYLDHASIDFRQMEEIACSLFADKAETIINRAKDILKQLRKLRDIKAEVK